ncbi:MAG: AAA family ATPase [Marmoricola sp.]
MLRLRIVGRLEADVDGAAVAMPPSERARALVGWLALHPGPHPRGDVAAGLWPDVPPDRARANLRTALWALHQSWGPASRYVEASRSSVGLVVDDVWVDAFDDGAYDGEALLLPGVEDDWVTPAREHHRRAARERLIERADLAEHRGELSEALRLSREVCRRSPLDEGAHRVLLHRLVLMGDRASAVQASREFTERLMSELGVRPSVSTRAAHAQVRAGKVRRPRPQLFGRADEVAQLTRVWKSAAAGSGQVVVLTGEAGIGKSSLIADLAHRVETSGGLVTTAVGMDVAGQTPFAAWLELCDGLVASVPPVPAHATWPGELNRLSGHLGGRLGHPGVPASVTAPELERLRVFESVLRLVEWSCSSRPTMLVLDDAHRTDRASLRLTTHVGRRLAQLPALLVLAQRDGARSADVAALTADLSARGVPVVEIALTPLDDRAVEALAASVHPLGAAAMRKVVDAAEGNPLLAVESSRALAAGDGGPPPNLRTAVRASCSRLPAAGALLVQLLAVAGRPLNPSELDRLGLEEIDLLEESATAEGLLARRGGALGFRHELLREAVYAGVPNPTRMHDRVATAIDPGQHADVAHHLAAAGREREAAQLWAAAAADAREVGALDEAFEFLVRATSDSSDGALWLELQEVCAWSGRHAEMEHAWDQAMTLLPQGELAAAWCRRGRQLRSVVCHPTASMSAYAVAHDLLTEQSDRTLRADVLLGLAWGDAVAGEGRRFEELLGQAETLLPATPDARKVSDIVEIRMQGLIRRGQFAEAVEVALQAPPHAVSARFPDRAFAVLMNAACASTCIGDHEGALVLTERAVEATTALPSVLMSSLAARAQLLARLGRHEEAAQTAQRQLRLAERLDLPGLAATTAHDLGLVALAAGRYEEAAELLDRALSEGAHVSRPTAGLRCAEALARAGDPAAARLRLRAAVLAPVGQADQPWALVPQIAYVQGLICAAEGDPGSAVARFDEATAAWHRVLESRLSLTAQGYLANLVDLGRPPVIGLIEPERELARIETSRHTLLSDAPR